MKYILSVLMEKEIEISSEIERYETLKGHPNEKLRQMLLKTNKERLQEIEIVKNMIIKDINL